MTYPHRTCSAFRFAPSAMTYTPSTTSSPSGQCIVTPHPDPRRSTVARVGAAVEPLPHGHPTGPHPRPPEPFHHRMPSPSAVNHHREARLNAMSNTAGGDTSALRALRVSEGQCPNGHGALGPRTLPQGEYGWCESCQAGWALRGQELITWLPGATAGEITGPGGIKVTPLPGILIITERP